MRFFTLLLLTAIIAFTGFSQNVLAEGKASIAIVDVKKIKTEAKVAKHVTAEIEKKRKEFQKKVTKEEEDLRKEDQDLIKQRSVLSPEVYEKKAVAFKKKVVEFQHNVQARRVKLENAYTKALSEIQKYVFEIVEEIANKKGFSLAITKSQAIYADDSLDISKDVLSELDKRLPKVKVVIED